MPLPRRSLKSFVWLTRGHSVARKAILTSSNIKDTGIVVPGRKGVLCKVSRLQSALSYHYTSTIGNVHFAVFTRPEYMYRRAFQPLIDNLIDIATYYSGKCKGREIRDRFCDGGVCQKDTAISSKLP